MGISSTNWINRIFDAKAATYGGVLRRSKNSVAKWASEKELVQEAKARGFDVYETPHDYIIVCDSSVPMKKL